MAGLLPVWPGRRRQKRGVLAFSTSDTAFRFVLASESGEHGATLAAWGTEARGYQTREAFMKRIKGTLPGAERVIVVLDPGEYQILQMEAPNVPADELRGAVRWRAMEFLAGSPQDYTLDVLTVTGAGEVVNKVIAVVAHNDVIRSHMQECEKLGHPASVIDVGETAQRNLLHAALLAEADAPRVAAALVANAGRALLVVAVQGQLCFFRRFEFDADMLAAPVDEAQAAMVAQGAGAETVTRSLTQLSRSLDLWDDSYPHLPIATLRVDAGAKTEAIVERIKADAGIETRPLQLSKVFKVVPGKAASPLTDTAYLPLLGALLRPASQP
jgi:MSHA biogenesis protein MshI